MKANMRYTDLGPIDGYALYVLDRKAMELVKVGKCKSIQEAKRDAIGYLISHSTVNEVHIDRYWDYDGFGDRNHIEKPSGLISRTTRPDKFAWSSFATNRTMYIDSKGKKI